jgi:hypothetical protein
MNITRRLGTAAAVVLLTAIAAISQASSSWAHVDPAPGNTTGPIVVPVPVPAGDATTTSPALSIWALVAAMALGFLLFAAALLIARQLRRGHRSHRSHATSH